jgi:hypothetical protein
VNPQLKAKGKPGKNSPASSRWIYPRPPLLRNFTKEIHGVKVKPSKPKPPDGDFVAATRGLSADAFFGASPVVASALDLRVGRDPFADHIQTNRHFFSARPKPDISTLQRIGHFYIALTGL